MSILSEDAKQRLSTVVDLGKTIFHYAFIPTIIYLGYKQGADPGMPPITPSSFLW